MFIIVRKPSAAKYLAAILYISSDYYSYNKNLLGERAGCNFFLRSWIVLGTVDADKSISYNRYFSYRMRNHLYA